MSEPTTPPPAPDQRDARGRYLLRFDTRYTLLGVNACAVVLWLTANVRRGNALQLRQTRRGALAIARLARSVPIASVFILTTAPAIEKLSDGQGVIVGLVSCIGLAYLAVGEIRAVLRRTA